ncbi:hypothetical protein D3C81_1675020 [compost metagenome]
MHHVRRAAALDDLARVAHHDGIRRDVFRDDGAALAILGNTVAAAQRDGMNSVTLLPMTAPGLITMPQPSVRGKPTFFCAFPIFAFYSCHAI